MSVTLLPPAPTPSDTQAEFDARAFAFAAALNQFGQQINTSAEAVNTNAGTAATQAGNAAASATQSASSATASANSATQSATSATQSATSATQSAASAAASATSASQVASNATAIANQAAATASAAAATSATQSAASAAASATSASQAAASADRSENAVEQYLGPHPANPLANKTGGPLRAGDWYINTTSGVILVYSGTVWVQSINANPALPVSNIVDGAVLLSKIQPIPSRHLIGRVSAGTGQAELVPLSSIVSSYSYDTRGDLRTLTNVAQDSLAVVDGLGLFQFSAGSDEPDDDESCFATATGRWLMQAPSWDVVAMWALPDEAVQDENDEDEPLRFDARFPGSFDARFPGSFDARFATRVLRGTALCAITSVATIGAASFTGAIAGAEVGDFVIATPPGELGATAADTARLAFHARVTGANTVTITLTNASASTATTNAAIRVNWPVAVIRNI